MRKTGFLKPSEFHPEHFENGRNFKKSDFVAYIEASENLLKTLYTKYLFCIWGGVLLSFLFSKAVGGFAGNMLALVCLFTGFIAGGIINAKAVMKVNETAARLGITKADVAAARRHIKYGTVAWTNGEGETSERAVESAAGE